MIMLSCYLQCYADVTRDMCAQNFTHRLNIKLGVPLMGRSLSVVRINLWSYRTPTVTSLCVGDCWPDGKETQHEIKYRYQIQSFWNFLILIFQLSYVCCHIRCCPCWTVYLIIFLLFFILKLYVLYVCMPVPCLCFVVLHTSCEI